MTRLKDPEAVRKIAKKSLFEALDHICEGAIIVDREARVVWLSEKYASRLKLQSGAEGAIRGPFHLKETFDLTATLHKDMCGPGGCVTDKELERLAAIIADTRREDA